MGTRLKIDKNIARTRTGEEISLPRAYYGLAVLMLAFMLAMVDRVVLALLVDPIRRDFDLTDTEFGLLNGLAFALFYLVMAIPIARLADRTSRRRIIAVGVTVWSAMTALCGIAQTGAQLFLARMGVGLGEAALSPAAYSMLSDMFPEDRMGRAFGIYNAGALVGFGASFIVGGSLIALIESYPNLSLPLIGSVRGWQAVFLAVAAPGFLLALLLYSVREPARRSKPATNTVPASRAASSRTFGPFMRAHAGFFAAYFLAFGCINTVLYGTLSWLPALFTRVHGLDKGMTGVVLGIGIGIASPLGAICGGLLADRMTRLGRTDGPMIIGMIGALGALAFVILAPVVPDWRLSVALICGLFFWLTFPTPVGPAGIQMIVPAEIKAQVTAAYVIAAGLTGMVIGSVVIGMFNDQLFQSGEAVGWSIALFGAIICPLTALSFQLLRRKFGELRVAADLPETARS